MDAPAAVPVGSRAIVRNVPARAYVLLIPLLLSACAKAPTPYPLPEQRAPLPEFRAYRPAYLVSMADADAEKHILSDIIGPPRTKWRWTGKRPTVQIAFGDRLSLDFVMDFVLMEHTMKDTGPVTVSFLINEHKLDSVLYTQPGVKHFEKAIPEEWLVPGKEAVLEAELDKMWSTPEDNAKLGMIFVGAGLRER